MLLLGILSWGTCLALSYAGYVGDQCEDNKGVCTLLQNCEVAYRQVQEKRSHEFERCGFQWDDEIVCCPKNNEIPVDRTVSKAGSTVVERVEAECKKIINSSIPPLDLHIIGGTEAALGEFPHMTALGYPSTSSEGSYDFVCGGSLISSTYVLTAAHCVDNGQGITPTIARLGTIDIRNKQFDETTDIRIVETIKHPQYTRALKYNDIALLRLEKPAETSSVLNPICLETNMDDPEGQLIITGWGTISNTKSISSEDLLKANITAVSRSECGNSYTNWRKLNKGIASSQLCAGDRLARTDSCQGDSGGPLVRLETDAHYRLVGVTSFGRGCGSPAPAVYTRVAAFLPWIQSHVWPS